MDENLERAKTLDIKKSAKNLFTITWSYDGKKIIESPILMSGHRHRKEYKEAIEILKKLLKKKPIPQHLRAKYWMVASGATREKMNNKDYYQNLLNNFPDYIPSRYSDVIEVDLSRTYPQDRFFKDEKNVKKLRNVLIAYSRRNSNVGYIQGFNFIVARLLMITDDEENSFWIFTRIIENILPVEYFNELCGLMGDCAVALKLLKDSDREEIKHLYKLNFEMLLNNLIYRWFLSLFVENTSYETFLCVWDALFLEGNIVLFRAAFALLSLISKDIIKTNTIEDITSLFENKISHFSDYQTLIKLLFSPELIKMKGKNKINYYDMKDIFELRESSYRVSTEQILASKKNIKTVHSHNNENEIKQSDCDLDWPFCLNEADNALIDRVFTIKVLNNVKIEDMFYIDYDIINTKIEENQEKIRKKNELKNQNSYNELSTDFEKAKDKIEIYSDLLIQRNSHSCHSNKATHIDIITNNEIEGNSFDNSKVSSLNKSISDYYNKRQIYQNINIIIGGIEKSEQIKSTMFEIQQKKFQSKKPETNNFDDDVW